MGRCIGLDNYCFYFRFVFLTWWGSLFLAGTSGYLRATVAPDSDVLFFTAIAACATGVAVGVLGSWHLYLLLSAQTTVEFMENWSARWVGAAPTEWGRWGGPFDVGVSGNIRQAFGEGPWLKVLLLPVGRREA